MADLIQEWGYLAVLIGSFVEGESVILTAGVLASQGLLSLKKIIIVAFFGSLLADQLLFFIGYFFGHRLLGRFPHFNEPIERSFQLLRHYDTWFILSFRFIYGIRTISPIVIGMAKVQIQRFAILNIIAAAVWAVLSCCAGYFFGEYILNNLSSFWKGIVIGGTICASLAFVIWKGKEVFVSLWHALKTTMKEKGLQKEDKKRKDNES